MNYSKFYKEAVNNDSNNGDPLKWTWHLGKTLQERQQGRQSASESEPTEGPWQRFWGNFTKKQVPPSAQPPVEANPNPDTDQVNAPKNQQDPKPDNNAPKQKTEKPATPPKPNPNPPSEIPGWQHDVNGVQGYSSQIPMLALLAGAGALGGLAFSSKKKKGAGALYGGLSLPALYMLYLAARRNGVIGGNTANGFDTFTQENINKPVNGWFTGTSSNTPPAQSTPVAPKK